MQHTHNDKHHDHDHDHGHAHHEPGFWGKYVFSTDHKVIGIQYAITSLVFLLLGFSLIMMMRWQLAYPGKAIPIVGGLLQKALGDAASGGIMSPDLYNAFGAMHGTIMVFLGIVPLAFAAFGNFVVPLQIGAVDMAFPRINMASYQSFAIGGVIMLVSFFIPGGGRRKRDGLLIHHWRRSFRLTGRRSGLSRWFF